MLVSSNSFANELVMPVEVEQYTDREDSDILDFLIARFAPAKMIAQEPR